MRWLTALACAMGWLAGCAEEGEPAAIMAVDAAPPGFGLSSTPAALGQPFDLYVEGLAPGSRTWFVFSASGAGPGPCMPVGRPCLGVLTPSLLGSSVADAAGVARFALTAPTYEATSWFQAFTATRRTLDVTNVVEVPFVPGNLDTDGDGLLDVEELALGTRLDDPDTDNDALNDGVEVNNRGTDPLRADTDGDLCVDGLEVVLGLDPLDSDTDDDGIRDGLDLRPLQVDPLDPFVVDDAPATAPGADVRDPEFEPMEGRVVWQDLSGHGVWTCEIDPLTGVFSPPDGHGTLLDVDVAPISFGRNGPEWALSSRGPQALWTRIPAGIPHLVRAVRSGRSWQVEDLVDTELMATPIGSMDPLDPNPRSMWFREQGGQRGAGWVELEHPLVRGELPYELRFARWIEGERAIIGVADVAGVRQVIRYDIDAGVDEVLTVGGVNKGSVFAWRAPEFNNELVFFTTHADWRGDPTSIVLYREINGVWTAVMDVPMPAGFPYVVSPEPLIYNGRSYVSYLSSSGPENRDNGVSVVWVASLDPARPLVRRVSNLFTDVRKDPEIYLNGARPWVYYTTFTATGARIRRCELGL